MSELKANIMAMVGPKGGVGKTTISVNLAIALSRLGKKVTVVDLDLGASNLHTYLGLKQSRVSLNDFVLKKVDNLSDIVISTDIDGMSVICGGDIPGIANLHYQKKMKLIRHLKNLKADIVLLDLGAGASFNVVDFVIFSQQGLLVTTPEIPSLYNLYSFIKTYLFRRLIFKFKGLKNNAILTLLEDAKDFEANPHLNTMNGILTEAEKIDPASVELINGLLNTIKPFVIVNRAKSQKDSNTGKVIQNLMNTYLNINSSVLFSVHEDNRVGYSLTKSRPVMIEAPDSLFASDINSIAAMLCRDYL
ncbi:putative ATP binding protein homolog to RS-1 DMR_40820 [Desulfamplus magnetovallimortis]|uniref:Putative ATP binding protein homolog to RS-1 DMR_40820 n=1 Tax=Desulfamplus magnetovallimortis TaxID=1246637 RepID=L0R5E1_9BACT|nr:AAA family ATPase [Desulfamplus magnetovallimortis]CCO06735.1 putative ATP binding protein homolog to RS-1 DMR_40820 [Desulfamplus magnetovallimortis BW-1]SLM32786.1 putative ATP binding protein homolog to RS-1 DMR_40820 [Desulfamplus magnetovallimortis]